MKNYCSEISVETTKAVDLVDITDLVLNELKKSKIMNGLLCIYSPHTTTALRVNEFEHKLKQDMLEFFEKIAEAEYGYLHDKATVDDRPNAHAHLKGLFLNSSEAIPVREGRLVLGQWQRILFIEMDGARKRKCIVQVLGE